MTSVNNSPRNKHPSQSSMKKLGEVVFFTHLFSVVSSTNSIYWFISYHKRGVSNSSRNKIGSWSSVLDSDAVT